MMDAMIESCVLIKTGSVPSTPNTFYAAPAYPRLDSVKVIEEAANGIGKELYFIILIQFCAHVG